MSSSASYRDITGFQWSIDRDRLIASAASLNAWPTVAGGASRPLTAESVSGTVAGGVERVGPPRWRRRHAGASRERPDGVRALDADAVQEVAIAGALLRPRGERDRVAEAGLRHQRRRGRGEV